MLRIRSLSEGEAFDIPGAPAIAAAYGDQLERGATRPEWSFILSRNGVDRARVGLRVEDTCPPHLLGRLPPRETYVTGLWLPWDEPDVVATGRALLEHAFDHIRGQVPDLVQAVVNRASTAHIDIQRQVFESMGTLFQEKHGYGWQGDDTPRTDPVRLSFSSLSEVGHARYRDTLARAGHGTLDRNDRWYRELAGVDNWGEVFMTFCDETDAANWLLASAPDGEDVG
ncbi:MAG: hypothetical protein AAGC55_26745, partial [Myxococcota bacterium]